MSADRIPARFFYTQYSGHPPAALRRLADSARRKPAVWLLGDSTLDNKYWIPFRNETHPDEAVHARLLDAPVLKRDVSYWMNKLLPSFVTFNCAVEASSVAARRRALLAHDQIVSDSFGDNDVVVVSLGGNDVALCPSLRTIFSVLMQVYTRSSIGFEHLVSLFGDEVQRFVVRVLAGRRPRLVVLCGLYFPDEARQPSWASFVLRVLRYNSNPAQLQRLIATVFDVASASFNIPDVPVVAVPFFHVMDGKNSNHYVARVEPSEEGAHVMASMLRDAIERELAYETGGALEGEANDASDRLLDYGSFPPERRRTRSADERQPPTSDA